MFDRELFNAYWAPRKARMAEKAENARLKIEKTMDDHPAATVIIGCGGAHVIGYAILAKAIEP